MWQKILLISSLLLAGCASQSPNSADSVSPAIKQHQAEYAQHAQDPFGDSQPIDAAFSQADDARDPFEPVNRVAWVINYDVLDPYLVRPVVHGYADYVAVPIRESIQNAMLNLEEPASFVNHLVTGDMVGAGTNLVRFGINSTVGVLGFFDVAEKMTLSRRSKDFSQVLGQLGVGKGPFFMVPFYGPTTLRELSGDMVDGLYFPYDVMTFAMRAGKFALNGLYERSKLIDREPLIDNALDPYGLTRDLYLQYQDAKVGKDITESDEGLADFMDEIDE